MDAFSKMLDKAARDGLMSELVWVPRVTLCRWPIFSLPMIPRSYVMLILLDFVSPIGDFLV